MRARITVYTFTVTINRRPNRSIAYRDPSFLPSRYSFFSSHEFPLPNSYRRGGMTFALVPSRSQESVAADDKRAARHKMTNRASNSCKSNGTTTLEEEYIIRYIAALVHEQFETICQLSSGEKIRNKNHCDTTRRVTRERNIGGSIANYRREQSDTVEPYHKHRRRMTTRRS